MDSPKHSVKSCGKAHAYCKVCRPDVAEAISGPKPPPRPGTPPCRNCGVCNECLGLVAPDGMRVCRKCGETKNIEGFRKKGPNRDRSSTCKACSKQSFENAICKNCDRTFWRHLNGYTEYCRYCVEKVDRPCAHCGKPFTAKMAQRKFCSDECRNAEKLDLRKKDWRNKRDEILRAYGGDNPSCSCCGESERFFLAIDHIDGGGHKQYKELGGGGFTNWIRKNNYPPVLRILCHNCNHGRHLNGGTCPHEDK